MSMRRRRTGRMKIDFAVIEKIAAAEIATAALAAVATCAWKLTRHSAFYRCKNGRYTLCLVWHGSNGETLTSTMRNIELAEAL